MSEADEHQELFDALEPLLRAALEPDSEVLDGADAPLDLRSIEVVVLVDLLESSLDILFDSDDVRPEHFATRRALVALLHGKGARCG